MKSSKTIVIAAAITAFALPQFSSAACSHTTSIRNDSDITLRLVELKSSYAQPVFKSQWTGTRVIPPGRKPNHFVDF